MFEAINTAVELEIEGRECYLDAGRQATNEAGRALLLSLAEEEDGHRRRFQELYAAISQGLGWPAVPPASDMTRQIRKNLVAVCRSLGVKVDSAAGELEAVKAAIDKEKKSHEFYRAHAAAAAFETERQFYANLADEEWEHAEALQDYAEYLSDPAGWFVNTEHPSLDGG